MYAVTCQPLSSTRGLTTGRTLAQNNARLASRPAGDDAEPRIGEDADRDRDHPDHPEHQLRSPSATRDQGLVSEGARRAVEAGEPAETALSLL